jgi:ferrous iron transport protein A
MTTLAELEIGQTATVRRIEGSDDIAVRLLEMGLTPGVEVKLVGAALLGDPVELEVRGYHLSLRKSEAKRVEVAAGR